VKKAKAKAINFSIVSFALYAIVFCSLPFLILVFYTKFLTGADFKCNSVPRTRKPQKKSGKKNKKGKC